MKTHFYLYKIENIKSGMIYIGIHSTKNLDDGYFGSGTNIKNDIKKEGISNFKKTILNFYNSVEELLTMEGEIVNIEFIRRSDTYNISLGGCYINTGFAIVKDINNKIQMIDVNNPKYISGELVGVTKGKFKAIDSFGKIHMISKDDPRYKRGELVGINKNKISVSDKDGNTSQVYINDPKYISGELIGINKNKVVCKSNNGDILRVDSDDPRYISGELVGINKGKKFTKINGKFKLVDKPDDIKFDGVNKGMVTVKDKNGDKLRVSKDDPRYISGELVGVNKGMIAVVDRHGNIIQVSKDDPRYTSGEFISYNRKRRSI